MSGPRASDPARLAPPPSRFSSLVVGLFGLANLRRLESREASLLLRLRETPAVLEAPIRHRGQAAWATVAGTMERPTRGFTVLAAVVAAFLLASHAWRSPPPAAPALGFA